MNYHINTILVWDSFKKNDECPLCAIQSVVEGQLVDQYLDECVMVDSYRADVNRLGFCPNHFVKLYKGENKCGLALQTHTRFGTLRKKIKATDNVKKAAQLAESIKKELSTCIICDTINFNMQRYYSELPKMYADEKQFAEVLRNCKGFCLKHLGLLLAEAKHAGKSASAYLADIFAVEEQNLNRLDGEIKFFTEKFDYRNTSKPWGTSQDALPRTIEKIHGKILK